MNNKDIGPDYSGRPMWVDSRCVLLPHKKHIAVNLWAFKHKIKVTCVTNTPQDHAWLIEDDRDRMFFMLSFNIR